MTLRRGGKLLYDSARRSPIRTSGPSASDFRRSRFGRRASGIRSSISRTRWRKFRTEYYELGESPILKLAYSDLGQTEKRKYANRGTTGAASFASHVYRESGFMTPDPNKGTSTSGTWRTHLQGERNVYPMREVARWSDGEKRAKIKPGLVRLDPDRGLDPFAGFHDVGPSRSRGRSRGTPRSPGTYQAGWSGAHEPLPPPLRRVVSRKTPKEAGGVRREGLLRRRVRRR